MRQAVVYSCPTRGALRLDRGADDGLTFRKQLIYEGEFVHPTGDDGKPLPFGVDRELMHNWIVQHSEFKRNGIKVPLPIKHSESPEDNRGELLELEMVDEIDEQGKPRASLYGVLRFRDAEAAKLAKTAQTSIFVPPEFVDGKGNKYLRPITHVALTDYPVVPKLGEFSPIIASLKAKLPNKVLAMSIATLAEKMQLPTADKDEPTLEVDIVTAYQNLQKQVADLQAMIDKYKAEFGELPDAEGGAEGEGAAVAASLALTQSPMMRGMLRQTRRGKIEALQAQGRITPAQRKGLEEMWLTDESLTLSLSTMQRTGKDADAQFESVLDVLKHNKPLKLGETSGAQGSEHKAVATDLNKHPLVADAERRRKEHDERVAKTRR